MTKKQTVLEIKLDNGQVWTIQDGDSITDHSHSDQFNLSNPIKEQVDRFVLFLNADDYYNEYVECESYFLKNK